uniref:Uncharacterized protein n=1 Tax=viral metagenome TaxID=1070528 RepID=A0A6C0J2I3_9ZZZZ
MNTKQKVFIVFIAGFSILSTSILMINTEYFLYLFMVGIWTMIFSGVLFKTYAVQTSTTRLDMGQKEQFLSDIKLLLS